ncbi:hypothetical protein ACFXAT_36910, partial [Streptomyces sp. NPDC059479]
RGAGGGGGRVSHPHSRPPPARRGARAGGGPRAGRGGAAGAARGDPGIAGLVRELLGSSEEFAALWREHRVSGLGRKTKIFQHPDAGRITLTYQTFDVQHTPGQHLLVGTPPPNADSLTLLASMRA